MWDELFIQTSLRLSFILFLFFVFSIFESFIPAEAHQPTSGRWRNIVYTFFFLFLGAMGISTLFFLPTLTYPSVSNSNLVIVVTLFTSFFLSDFLFYWYHRAQHRFSWLWRIHELHHSDAAVNATTSMRTYWLEYPIQSLLILTPVHVLIGSNSITKMLSLFLLTVWLLFTHANLRIHLGFFTPVLTGPQLHRIHHSILPHHQHKNFAQYFPVLDILFGTYYAPTKNEYPITGIPSLSSNASFLTVMLRPFRSWFGRLY